MSSVNGVNAPRPGDAQLVIDGEPHTLRLTLGALAEIEESLGEGSLPDLAKRLEAPRAGDLLRILHALLRGGGADLTLAALSASDIDFPRAAAAVAAAFGALRDAPSEGEASAGERLGKTLRGEKTPTEENPARSPGATGLSAP